MRLLQAVIVLIAIGLISAAGKGTKVYRNEEFGISVPIPTGAILCPVSGDQHDHGPVFLLGDRSVKRCQDSERGRSVVVFAGYNAAEATKRLHEFLEWECLHVSKGPCTPARGGLAVVGRPSEAATVNRPDGWTDIIVVTQAGKPDPDFDASVPSINYELRLHTRTDHLEEDLHMFRTVLSTITFSPDQAPANQKSRRQ